MLRPYTCTLLGIARIIQAAFLPRGVLSTLFLILIYALSAVGSHGESAAEPGVAQNPAPASFIVGERLDDLYFFPCADCHEYMDPNKKVRQLDVEEGHPALLGHGDGQMWCFACHDPSNYSQLLNLLAEPIDFDQGYQVCSGCHSRNYRDWTYGGHGKRIANWRGERRLYSCVECHNPHKPSIPPRAPKPPPSIRAGLKPMAPEVIDEARNPNRPQWEQTHGQ